MSDQLRLMWGLYFIFSGLVLFGLGTIIFMMTWVRGDVGFAVFSAVALGLTSLALAAMGSKIVIHSKEKWRAEGNN